MSRSASMFLPVFRVYSAKAASKMARNWDDDVSGWELEDMAFGGREEDSNKSESKVKIRLEDFVCTEYTSMQRLDTAKRHLGAVRDFPNTQEIVADASDMETDMSGGGSFFEGRRPSN